MSQLPPQAFKYSRAATVSVAWTSGTVTPKGHKEMVALIFIQEGRGFAFSIHCLNCFFSGFLTSGLHLCFLPINVGFLLHWNMTSCTHTCAICSQGCVVGVRVSTSSSEFMLFCQTMVDGSLLVGTELLL